MSFLPAPRADCDRCAKPLLVRTLRQGKYFVLNMVLPFLPFYVDRTTLEGRCDRCHHERHPGCEKYDVERGAVESAAVRVLTGDVSPPRKKTPSRASSTDNAPQ